MLRSIRYNKLIVGLIIAVLALTIGYATFGYLYHKKNAQAANGNKTITSQSDWEAGARTNIDTTSQSGSIKLNSSVVTTSSWEPLTANPTSVNNGAHATDGTDLYIFGGERYPTMLDTAYKYDVSESSWTPLTSMPQTTSRASAEYANGYFYVFGGYRLTEYTSKVYRYDPIGNSWAEMASMPQAGDKSTAELRADGKIYVWLGFCDTGIDPDCHKKIFVYNISTNTWSTITSALAIPSDSRGGIYNDILYTFGGYNAGPTGTDKIYKLNDSNNWEQVGTLNYARYDALVANILGKFYIFSGERTSVECVTHTEEFNPETGISSNITGGSTSSALLPVNNAVINNQVYKFGGPHCTEVGGPSYNDLSRWPDSFNIVSPGSHVSAATQLDGTASFTGWTTFVPNGTIPANTSINFRFRTSNDHVTWTSWSASTPYAASIDLSGLDQRRYLQVETTLANTDGTSTPTLNDYTANYTYSDICVNFDHLTITPATASLSPSGTTTFTGRSWNTLGAEMPGVTFNYSATGGTINGSGNYTAPTTAGTYTITVTSSCGGSASATVTVSENPPNPPTTQCQEGYNQCEENANAAYSSCIASHPGDSSCWANYCSAVNSCLTACGFGGDGRTFDTIIEKPSDGEIYYIGGTMSVNWHYSLNNSRLATDGPLVRMYLSTDGGRNYTFVKNLVSRNNTGTERVYYGQPGHGSEPKDYYNIYKDPSDPNNISKAYLYYNWRIPSVITLPTSLGGIPGGGNLTIATENAKIKLEPILYSCSQTYNPGISGEFKIKEKPKQLYINVTPNYVSIKRGTTKSFTVRSYDEFGNEVTDQTEFIYGFTTGATLAGVQGNIVTILAGQNLGNYRFKVIGTNRNMTRFTYAYFSVVADDPYLDGMGINSPNTRTLIENPYPQNAPPGMPISPTLVEKSQYLVSANPLDQYGNYFPDADVSWQVLDSRAGTVQATSNDKKVMFRSGRTQGCYPNIIKATATWRDKTFSQYSSVKIVKNTSAGNINIKQIGFHYSTNIYKPGQVFHFQVVVYDEAGNAYDVNGQFIQANQLTGLTITPEFIDSRIGEVSFMGDEGFIDISNNTGFYNPAITFKAVYNGKELTKDFPLRGLTITNDTSRFDHILVTKWDDYLLSSRGADTYAVKANSPINLYFHFVSNFGVNYSAATRRVTLLDSSAGNFYKPYLFVASNKKGTYKDVLKIEAIENGQVIGTKYVSFIVTDDVNLQASCLVSACQGCLPCDPKDPGCCNPNDENCTLCANPPCGGGGGDIFPPIVDPIVNIGSPVLALLIIISLLGSGSFSFAARKTKEKIASQAVAGGITALTGLGYIRQLIDGLLALFSKKAYKTAWGVVYDYDSKKPIQSSRVQLYSWPDNRLIQTVYTNKIGEFSFMAKSGQYYLRAEKGGFSQMLLSKESRLLPSHDQPFKAKRTDGYYSNIYLLPEVISQGGQEKQTLEVAVPLIPKKSAASAWLRFWHKFFYILELIRLPMLVLGTILTVIDFYWHGAWYNWLEIGVYSLLWIFEIYVMIFQPKTWGLVLGANNKPEDLVLVRLIDKSTDRIMDTEVTAKDGRFVLNANPGKYYIKLSKAGKKEVIAKEIDLKHLQNVGGLKLHI